MDKLNQKYIKTTFHILNKRYLLERIFVCGIMLLFFFRDLSESKFNRIYYGTTAGTYFHSYTLIALVVCTILFTLHIFDKRLSDGISFIPQTTYTRYITSILVGETTLITTQLFGIVLYVLQYIIQWNWGHGLEHIYMVQPINLVTMIQGFLYYVMLGSVLILAEMFLKLFIQRNRLATIVGSIVVSVYYLYKELSWQHGEGMDRFLCSFFFDNSSYLITMIIWMVVIGILILLNHLCMKKMRREKTVSVVVELITMVCMFVAIISFADSNAIAFQGDIQATIAKIEENPQNTEENPQKTEENLQKTEGETKKTVVELCKYGDLPKDFDVFLDGVDYELSTEFVPYQASENKKEDKIWLEYSFYVMVGGEDVSDIVDFSVDSNIEGKELQIRANYNKIGVFDIPSYKGLTHFRRNQNTHKKVKKLTKYIIHYPDTIKDMKSKIYAY